MPKLVILGLFYSAIAATPAIAQANTEQLSSTDVSLVLRAERELGASVTKNDLLYAISPTQESLARLVFSEAPPNLKKEMGVLRIYGANGHVSEKTVNWIKTVEPKTEIGVTYIRSKRKCK